MSAAPDPDSTPDRAPESAEADRPSDGTAVDLPAARLWAWAVGAGLVAGLAGWLVGEGILAGYYDALHPVLGAFPPPSVRLGVIQAEKEVAILTFTALGALLGLALGVAGGVVRRSVVAAGWAALAGLILGGVAAGAAAVGLVSLYWAHQNPLDDSLLMPLLTHAGVAAAAGAAGGLALGIGLRGWVGWTFQGGLLGAAAGASLYELVGALAFPYARTGEPVSGVVATRGFFLLAVTLLTAAGAVWMARNPVLRSRSGRKPAPLPE
jgi:hypothetical protein